VLPAELSRGNADRITAGAQVFAISSARLPVEENRVSRGTLPFFFDSHPGAGWPRNSLRQATIFALPCIAAPSEMSMKIKTARWTTACAVVALAAGCSSANKPTAENFTKTLNDWYQDHNDCLFPQGHAFPYEVAPGSTAAKDKKEMDALADAGLATRLEDKDMHVDRYTLNAAGARYGPRFCYGHREVTGITSFTPPGPRDGFTETTVTYQYTMHDVPVWATTDQIKGSFPQVAKSLADSPTDQITLATVGAGWQVPH
jgi:hypothetical protein